MWAYAAAIAGFSSVAVHTAVLVLAASSDRFFFASYRAISDLGIAHEPYADLINHVAFELTGVLVAVFGTCCFLGFRGTPILPLGGASLALGGAAFALAGTYPFPSPYHFGAVGAASACLSLGISVVGFGYACWRRPRLIRSLSAISVGAIVANLAAFGFRPDDVGHTSKTAFSLTLAWIAAASAEFVVDAAKRNRASTSRSSK
jgi:hypothetical membrane protein